jgi:hypothetical protein
MKFGKAAFLSFIFVFSIAMQAQDGTDGIKPIPVLTGYTSYFTRVNGGVYQDAPGVTPLLLVPFGDKWLVEARGSYSDTFAKDAQGNFVGTNSYGLAYAQIDYIASKYVTLTAGRFITPFNIYGERLAPSWIRALQTSTLTSPETSGSALGGMMRGGFSLNDGVNINYATYFSTNNTNHIVATDRSSGGRVSFFLPRQRLEVGGSFQQVLQADRAHSSGAFLEWQPNRDPLTIRSEFVRTSGTKGTGYWVESVYRLSQIHSLRRLELAARGQQFYAADNLSAATIKKLGALGKNVTEADGGLNYYLRSDVRASATYGRQLILDKNTNLWVFGMTYRFVTPLWPQGSPQ